MFYQLQQARVTDLFVADFRSRTLPHLLFFYLCMQSYSEHEDLYN